MKKLTTIVSIAILSTGLYSVPAQSDEVVTAMCNYIIADHKDRFRDKLRSNKIKLKRVYEDIGCNGQSLLRFSMIANANDVGGFIVKRLSSSMLKKTEADGVSIYDWANSNGHTDSPITAAIKKRAKL